LGGILTETKVFGEVAKNLVKNVAQEVPLIGGYLGGGRIPISSALPYNEDGYEALIDDIGNLGEGGGRNMLNELKNPLYNFVLPFGGNQLKKTIQGVKMFDEDLPISGSYTDSGNLRFPVEDTLANRVQAGVFGQWASENARDYFDNDYAPLNKKQTQEFIDVDIPIKDYREYREGLSEYSTLDEKVNYIADLDLPISKKNLLINNIANRKDDIDLTDYDEYGNFEEFDYYSKNPEKKLLAKAVGGYDVYRTVTQDLADIESDKDKFGNAISGSKKKKVVDYINSLNADYGEKIILFKSAYKSDDTYNYDIIEYLNSRDDISYDEMAAILKELGFTVKSDGTVTW
jgi:hypothetical protein